MTYALMTRVLRKIFPLHLTAKYFPLEANVIKMGNIAKYSPSLVNISTCLLGGVSAADIYLIFLVCGDHQRTSGKRKV